MIDTLIIGAGPSGLCAAKTILQHNKAADVVLVDGHGSVGGVWSKEQLYPTLKTNNLFSTMDFSDFPMDPARFGVQPGQHVTGEVMHAYLSAYAEHFKILHRIRFNTQVVEVRRRDASEEVPCGWDVEVGGGEMLQCERLVVATGVLNAPHLPHIDGEKDFSGPFIHSSELGRQAESLMSSPDIQTVAVIGGCKSAYDAVYLAASTGHKVEWIIRQSGRGPTWVFPTHTFLGPFEAWREKLVTRRIVSFMSPCNWPDYSGFAWLRSFLHTNSVGKFIAQKFWESIHADTARDCRYRDSKEFEVLEPEQSPFWYGTASGTLNYDQDFLSFISNGQVHIHRADISHLSPSSIHLRPNGASPYSLTVDAAIASTGYSAKPTITFSPASSHSSLGIPTTSLSPEHSARWANLDQQADLTIGSQFPRLLIGPHRSPRSTHPQKFHPGATSAAETPYTPWRLYRGIAPPGLTAAGDRSLVFVGMFSNIANTIRLEVQCLWAVAYFCGGLGDSVREDVVGGRVMRETALFQRYTELRSPYGHGRLYPDLVFDQLPYWDVLLHDLGLETRRKGGWRELVEAYGQEDYRGIVDEWIASRG
ncbi:cofactor FMO1 FAD enzyme [Lasiosphaeria hispida]|uniref:Cofactor FMO1 FAD enzyme n=1 Tax=Lasiosphaeria hispida TaxID=260671 RepID=A0AAJ0M923_9PEZI|nr:cofactor FMO1 FAD enzyme [Lasiosphaeria hispida]